MASVAIRDVRKAFGVDDRHPRRRCRYRRRRIRRAGRALGLRQVHPAAHDRRSGEHHRRRNPHRRPRGQRPAAERARRRHGVPELRALSAHDGRRQHGASRSSCAARRKTEIDAAVKRAADILGLAPYLAALSAPALRRPAPARRHGPRHRARSAGVPVRRAAVQSRRQAARADAHRNQGAAPAAQDHDRLRHPRPDRGHDHGRQDRRDA